MMDRRMDEWWNRVSAFLVTTLICLQITNAQREFVAGNHKLKRFVVDTENDRIYVGAVNKIFILNSNFVTLANVTTGPKLDNNKCTFLDDNRETECMTNSKPLTETDNHNKVLLIDKSNNELLTCGSVLQGTCEKRRLDTAEELETFYSFVPEKVLAAPTPNDEYETAAFIAHGPRCSEFGGEFEGDQDVLYTALSLFYIDGRSINGFTFLSSHELTGSNYLEYAGNNEILEVGTHSYFMEIDPYGSRNIVRSGFSANGFSYFVFLSQFNENGPVTSKIARVCQQDCTYNSYVEIPLRCESSGTEYNLIKSAKVVQPGPNLATRLNIATDEYILVTVFHDGTSIDQYGRNSAVCLYTMTYIQDKFTENIQECHNAQYQTVGSEFGDSFKVRRCEQTSDDINDQYCDTDERNSPLSGQNAARQTPILSFPDVHVTSIAVDVIGPYTVAFIGTSGGALKKVELFDDTKDVYDEDTIEQGQAIKPDMVFTEDSSHVLVMTQNKLFKVATSDCGAATTCAACSALKDPYCGWCSLQVKCSRREECENSQLTNRWTSHNAWCIGLESVTPNRASIPRGVTMVQATINSLPELTSGHTYDCVFGQTVQRGTKSSSRVKCATPMLDESILPVINGVKADHVEMDFFIKSSETGKRFLQDVFTFYSCDVYDRCSGCASAQWNCRWCVYDNACRSEFSNCTQGNDVTNEGSCPRITHTLEILVPNGVPTEIRIDAQNLPVPLNSQSGYECVVHLGEPAIRVPAARQNGGRRIVCQESTYTYDMELEKEEPSIAVYWNGNYLVERQGDSLNAEVYKCDVMGRDCSECISLDARNDYDKYDCGFCNTDAQTACVYNPTCTEPPRTECPPPRIDNITPMSSPIQGGTRITISGSDLGYQRSMVENAVRVGDQLCTLIEYEIARKIVCTVAAVREPTNETIHITINQDTQQYAHHFQFKDPYVTSFFPVRGPKSGGTVVTIEGGHLDTGSTVTVGIGGEMCVIRSKADDRITCVTGAVDSPTSNRELRLTYDTTNRRAGMRYQYTNDPKISSIDPLKTFLSGGRMVTVKGTDLNVVQKPQMYVIDGEDEQHKSNCEIESAEELRCPSPALIEQPNPDEGNPENQRKKRDTATPEVYMLGFILDGVANPWLNSSNSVLAVEVYPDPIFFPFENGGKTYAVGSDASLEIGGENINAAADENDITVTIGADPCVVKTISEDRLYCTPPKKKDNSAAHGKHTVVVEVGHLRVELGSLTYQFKKSTENTSWIIIVGVGGGILMSIIIIISIVYKRKKTQADRQYKKLQMQLDTLESNVRNECKQAFAELQTEISDFTSDISVIGIPYWDYKTYTFKVLFPSHADHPVLHASPDYKTNKFGSYDQGLHQFSQLLNSKQFMLIFIRTLEQQKNFSIRDKAVVASLLMIVLQDKMEYATEILKALLEELIDRSVEKKHPKLMLRRTESVVEKLLTNWLSIAMYGYVKKQSGKPLFMLYQAIKRQTEKGPVDGISSEARYSLSEDRLLREKIEPKTLTINLVQDGQKEPLTCRCLDCDTITQAKQKALDAIYLNTPFSSRPSVHDVDLEWRSGKSGHLPLQDEDVTTEVVHGWKKVNTLAHYHVPDGAVMALVTKRHKTEGVRQVHGRIEITSGSGLSGIQPIITMEEGQKVWHLVKHDDGIYISRSQKVISEIFLTRLLATKGTLQQYIDDLFMTILRVDNSIPPAIKWLFDLLDSAAKRHNILDPDVVHTWKSNSLPLRFWVNIIKNPDFVLDVNKSHICDSCLSVIAQTFMDACSTTDHKLGKDSPSNKLLFAKDIPRYRGWVSKYYKGIQDMAPVTDTDINEIMTEMSLNFLLQHYTAEFNVSIALKELFKYAHQYNFELLENLDEDPSARKLHLANMFEQVTAALDVGTMYRN